ncbi:hypothetical protein CK203_081039 [Vitis vinifera]|uniref:Uncharacterized protein n=1 Tax=Vitis vinifera TaxID=29760 RepID=A0A438DWW2_VITVI|nr:hypothetical protein CK203_081039 [Vitis vinifera]
MALQMEEVERDEGWSSSCLAKFNSCLGMPIEGFEEEILYLLRRMKGRIEQKSQDGVHRKMKFAASKSSRELKKLEWKVSYKRAKVATGMSRGFSGSGGAAGGVLVFWDNRLVELLEVEEGMFSVSCWFKNCVNGLIWVFTGMYRPMCSRDREDF